MNEMTLQKEFRAPSLDPFYVEMQWFFAKLFKL